MPPQRTQPKNTAFKPPRQLNSKGFVSGSNASSKPTTNRAPKAAPATASTSKSSSSARPNKAPKPAATVISSSPAVSDIEEPSDDNEEPTTTTTTHQQRRRSGAAANTSNTAVPPLSPESAASAPIPPKLLNRLLHEGFEDEDVRIGKEAMAVAGKYVETFVREAVARAMEERREADAESGGTGDGFLQVEDLEKAAPQLLLDF